MAYQIIALLAVYLLITAVVDQSATIALGHQTRLLLSLGAGPRAAASCVCPDLFKSHGLSVCA